MAGSDRPDRGGERLRGLLGRDRLERDIDDEFEAHIAHRVDDLVDGGMSPDEARATAEAEFGDRSRLRRASLDHRSRASRKETADRPWSGVLRDLGWTLRQLRRAPGFAGVVGLTLLLGVGAAVAIFSVVRAVVLEPLPYEDPAALLSLQMRTPALDPFSTSEPVFLEWREGLESMTDVGALSSRTETLRAPGEPRAVVRGYANAGLLALLGLTPALGRDFTAAEDRPSEAAPVALIGPELWAERFDGRATAVGETLDIDGRLFEVIGVLPDGIDLLFGRTIDALTPLAADPAVDRGEHYLDIVARLGPGVGLDRARADLDRLMAWQSANFEEDRGWSAAISPLDETLLGTATLRAGWILLAAAGLLLIMACLNVSNLLLARATARRGEIGLRAVLGAGRARLLRQLSVESVIISGFGSLLGIGAAVLALPWVRRLGGARIPRLEEATLDPVGAVAASGIVVLAVAVAGLAPALSLRGGAPASALRGSGRGGGSWGGGVRRTLVGVQVAMSVVLLLGTGLLFRSFVRLSQVDPGFDPNDRVTLTLAMPDAAYSWQERGPLVQEILRLGRAVPGVEALGATAVDPFSGYALANFIASATDMPDRAEDFTPIQWRVVTPGLFDALGLDVVAGRAFNDTDDGREGHPVIIDQRLANDLFGDPAEAVGRDLVWGDPEGSRIRVVGVVEALRDVELQADPFPMVYRSHRAIPWASMHLVARVADGAGPGVAAGLREAVRTAAPRLAVPDVESLQANVDRALAEPRFNVLLLGAFAVVGLALAVVGLYGLTAFEVRRRFREIGIRMSLGADATTLVKGFVTQRLGLAAVGLAVGMALAFPAARWLEALLFETSVADPLTWVGVAVTVIATTAVAAWIPARRASDVDPREVLSAE